MTPEIQLIDPDEMDSLDIEYDKLKALPPHVEVLEGKLSILTYFQNKDFNSETYKPEEKLKTKNEKDEEEVKAIPLTSYIRWRMNKDKSISSNAKIVEWSDGSTQLIIGHECFDIMYSNMDNIRYGIKAKDDVVIINKPVTRRVLLTKAEDDLNENEDDQIYNDDENGQDKSKVKLSYSYFDKKVYKKEEFSSRYPRRRNFTKEAENLSKKRKRSSGS